MSSCVMGIGFDFEKWKSSGDMLHNSVNIHNTTEL